MLETQLPLIDQEIAAIRTSAGVDAYRTARTTDLRAGEVELAGLRTRIVELGAVIGASDERVARLRAGELDDPRIHLHHASEPEKPVDTRRRALAETWAALSVGLLVVALAVILWFRILNPLVAVFAIVGGYLVIESFFRRDVRVLILRIALALAIVSMAIIVVAYLREVLLVVLLGLGVLLIVDNVGEVRRRGS